MHRTASLLAIIVAALVMLLATSPAVAAEPPPGIAYDGVVTVVFHDPEYDNGNGIPDADVMLWVLDHNGVPTDEEYLGMTDASGVVTFTDVFRVLDPTLEFGLEANAVTERTFVDEDGCTVNEFMYGSATASTGLELTIDVGIDVREVERTCPGDTPSLGPPVIVEGKAVDPDGEPLSIVHAEAKFGILDDGPTDFMPLPVTTGSGGSFRVEVPGWGDPGTEGGLVVSIIGPDVRTVEDEEGCLITWTLVARASWRLIEGETPDAATLVAAEEPLSGICGGATATPAPAAPGFTLPPTDTTGNRLDEGAGGLGAVLFLLLAISLGATIAADRRVSPRGN